MGKGEGEGERETEGGSGDVLRGLRLAVSCLFSSEDQTLASSVLKQHGGQIHLCCV